MPESGVGRSFVAFRHPWVLSKAEARLLESLEGLFKVEPELSVTKSLGTQAADEASACRHPPAPSTPPSNSSKRLPLCLSEWPLTRSARQQSGRVGSCEQAKEVSKALFGGQVRGLSPRKEPVEPAKLLATPKMPQRTAVRKVPWATPRGA